MAEAYEPHFLRCSQKDINYDFISEEQLYVMSSDSLNRLRHEIVGTISLQKHQSLHNCGWISRTAIHPNYSMNNIGEQLIMQVLAHSHHREGYYTVETVTTECQYSIRELMLRMGYGLSLNNDIIASSRKVSYLAKRDLYLIDTRSRFLTLSAGYCVSVSFE